MHRRRTYWQCFVVISNYYSLMYKCKACFAVSSEEKWKLNKKFCNRNPETFLAFYDRVKLNGCSISFLYNFLSLTQWLSESKSSVKNEKYIDTLNGRFFSHGEQNDNKRESGINWLTFLVWWTSYYLRLILIVERLATDLIVVNKTNSRLKKINCRIIGDWFNRLVVSIVNYRPLIKFDLNWSYTLKL